MKNKIKLLIFFAIVNFLGCGDLSDEVRLSGGKNPQDKDKDKEIPKTSSPYVGSTSSTGEKKSGEFKLEAGFGELLSKAQKKDDFSFYGGIQGQQTSR